MLFDDISAPNSIFTKSTITYISIVTEVNIEVCAIKIVANCTFVESLSVADLMKWLVFSMFFHSIS
jgi:hypothetical protein